jgi:hypothetical protein
MKSKVKRGARSAKQIKNYIEIEGCTYKIEDIFKADNSIDCVYGN